MTTQPIKVNIDKLASELVGKDIVNSRGLFHIISTEALQGNRIKATCVVTSHKLCADNLVNGVSAMNNRVFILTLAEAKEINKKPNVVKYFQTRQPEFVRDLDSEDIPF